MYFPLKFGKNGPDHVVLDYIEKFQVSSWVTRSFRLFFLCSLYIDYNVDNIEQMIRP